MERHRAESSNQKAAGKQHIVCLGTDDNESSTLSSAAKDNAFHVDTGVIPQAVLEDHASSELAELGLSVFNQDVFEQGIMEQVDQAFAKEEEQRLRKILQRELSSISDDIVLAKKDLDKVNKAEESFESLGSTNREITRQLESINKQKQNKIKQLRTLRVRRENVLKKLKGFDEAKSESQGAAADGDIFDEAFDLSGRPRQESKREQMIRTGEMTPFGTLVKTKSSKITPPKPIQVTEFEKQMMGGQSQMQKVKKDFSKYLKKKRETAASSSKIAAENGGSENHDTTPPRSTKKTNRFDERDWKVYDRDPWQRPRRQTGHRVYHEFSGDNQLSDEEQWNRDCDELMDCDAEDDYNPSREELLEDSTDDDNDASVSDEECDLGKIKRGFSGKKKQRSRKRPRRPPKYRGDSDDDGGLGRLKVKRDLSIRREKDDADPEDYQDRLLRQQKLEAKEAKAAKEKDSPSSEEDVDDSGKFDGGLQVPPKLWKKLYKYQKTGVRWLWELHTQQAGGIVGDEMGLGKTIQTIAFLASLRTSKVKNVNFPYKGLGPTIIICPTTVMHQWLKECHKWWPEFRVGILHSSGSYSGSHSELVRSIAKSFGILITSYSTLVIQQEIILRFNWHYVILDEGHKIRNPDAKVTLCCKQFRTPHRIVLSGSPIQNNLKELWSLFDFVFPGKLGTLPDFMQHFSVPIVQGGYSNATQIQVETAYRCACVLRDTINPYLIRRMKADVKQNLNLPGKNEQVLFCRLTEEQKNVYQEYLCSRECNAILQGKFQIFAGLIMLRKICNHPDLSTNGLQLFNKGPSDEPEDQFGHWSRSGKMVVVEALLRLWEKQGHRVLLFTQSKSMLDILERFVQDQGYRYLTMDGSTTISARQPLIDQYNKDPSIYLFLLTTRVGGLGVNLTGADRVIIFDPDWNPSTDMQARERAWRIGQQRQVTIYRLLTSGTIEEKIYHRQIFKQFLTNRILKDPKQRRLFKSQDLYELFTLGNQDIKEGTETSALFAGTGSDVKMPAKQRKTNRFDELEEQRRRERLENEEEDELGLESAEHKKYSRKERKRSRSKGEKEEQEEDCGEKAEDERTEGRFGKIECEEEEDSHLSSSEIERMKEFAKMLSRKMEADKQKKDHRSEGKKINDCQGSPEVTGQEDSKQALGCCQGEDESSIAVGDNNNCIRFVDGAVIKQEPLDDCDEQSLETVASGNKSKADQCGERERKLAKFTIPILKRPKSNEESYQRDDTVKHKRKREEVENVPQSSKEVEREARKQKKRRKHRDARFEGEKIPHLVKHCPLTKLKEEDEEAKERNDLPSKDDTGHDDYVLRELFKKTGIQGAMKHDKIMDSGRPDYAIVEAEAEKVAREAVAALRRSRQRCLPATSGQPTWTGQHGSVNKPRFGQKKNTLLVSKASKGEAAASSPTSSSQPADRSKVTSETPQDKLFDGSVSGNVSLSSKGMSLSSNDLLTRMQSRKRISAQSNDNPGDEDEDDFLRPDITTSGVAAADPKDEELLSDIRDYVAFMGITNGQASSQEIVLNFGSRLPPQEAPKFKAMLQQICELQAGGIWRLKTEFR